MYFMKEPEPVVIPDLSGWRATYVFEPDHPGSPTDQGFRDFLKRRGFSEEMVFHVTLESYGQQPSTFARWQEKIDSQQVILEEPRLPQTLSGDGSLGPRTRAAMLRHMR